MLLRTERKGTSLHASVRPQGEDEGAQLPCLDSHTRARPSAAQLSPLHCGPVSSPWLVSMKGVEGVGAARAMGTAAFALGWGQLSPPKRLHGLPGGLGWGKYNNQETWALSCAAMC